MKILQINCVYNDGSTGKIVYDIHAELQKENFESVVCYGRGKKHKESGVYKTCGELYSKLNNAFSRISGLMYGGCLFSTKKLISIIKRENPDVVHLHCLNGYFVNIYKLISWLKGSKIKTILTLHAEFMYTANCGHAFECEKWKTGCGNCPRLKEETKSIFKDATHLSWKKMKEAFDGFNDNLVVVSVSPWLMERAKQSPILADKKHMVVYNGLDTDIFKFYDTNELKQRHKIADEKIVFHATPRFTNDHNHIKGGFYVLQLAEKMKNENVKFIVAGDYDQKMNIPNNVIMLGRVNDKIELAKYYSMADVTLLTSKKETFSMVCAESLCCGTPVVGFKAGAPEQISLPEYSAFVEYGNIEALLEQMTTTLKTNYDKIETSRKAKDIYSKQAMTYKYMKTYLNE